MEKEIVKQEDLLFCHVSELIEQSRQHVKTAINTAMVYTYFGIGKYIVEDEQNGKDRATYGGQVIANLSARLTERFGDGWSVETLKKCRLFYCVYRKRIGYTPLTQLEKVYTVGQIQKSDNAVQLNEASNKTNISSTGLRNFTLSWSHYLVLMRIKNDDERSFYEIECAKQNWSVRQLQRQYNSSLYERLALSRDKDEVMRLAKEGQTLEKSCDVIKNPITLEFLGLKAEAAYTESKLENAIIDKLQDFLLEMGKGFLFEARQKRFTFAEDNFYIDLVCYNRLLQCYVLIDLKIDKLTHQDLGQMQMYVNYFDRYVKFDFEKPTIGILLCKEKNDALVELTLPQDANVYAAQYALYLPDKKLLQSKLNEWATEFEENRGQ